MANGKMRPGFHTVTPYLEEPNALELIEFIKEAFGATETYHVKTKSGGLHVELQIGDSRIMVGGGHFLQGRSRPVSLFLYLEDVDAVYQQALKAGATSLEEPELKEEGERRGGVQDRFGNNWYLSTYLGE